MQIRASWKQALKLCTPASIKLFTLITLKSMLDVIRVLMVPWFLIPFGLLIVLLCWVGAGSAGAYVNQFLMLAGLVIFILAARPSIGLKNGAYFKKNSLRALWMFFAYSVYVIPLLLVSGLGIYAIAILQRHSHSIVLLVIFVFLLVLLLSLFALMFIFGNNFALLFYMDRTQGTWLAFKRAYLMIWYNLPALLLYVFLYCVVLTLIVVFFITVLSGLLTVMSFGPYSFITIIVKIFLTTIIDLLCACLATNLYIKLVHDQYELYFPEDAHKE
jgi:hypothetical protein